MWFLMCACKLIPFPSFFLSFILIYLVFISCCFCVFFCFFFSFVNHAFKMKKTQKQQRPSVTKEPAQVASMAQLNTPEAGSTSGHFSRDIWALKKSNKQIHTGGEHSSALHSPSEQLKRTLFQKQLGTICLKFCFSFFLFVFLKVVKCFWISEKALCEFPMIIIVNVQTCTGGEHGSALHSPSGTVNFLLLLLTYKSVQVASTAQPYIPQAGLCEFSAIIVNVQICTGGEHSSALHSPSGTVNFLLLLLTYKSVQVASTAQPYIPQVGLWISCYYC